MIDYFGAYVKKMPPGTIAALCSVGRSTTKNCHCPGLDSGRQVGEIERTRPGTRLNVNSRKAQCARSNPHPKSLSLRARDFKPPRYPFSLMEKGQGMRVYDQH